MLAWCVEALTRVETVSSIVIAAPPGLEGQVEEAARTVVGALSPPRGGLRATRAVAGGETRAESVRAALESVETDLVVIHDAARPLVTTALVDSVVQRLLDRPDAVGVIAAAPLADTVKRAREGDGPPVVERTESRERLWAAQTPQAFRTGALRRAYGAGGNSTVATDEAMLVEAAGGIVLIEPAPSWNLKVTTPEDLRIAELLAGAG
jgi:2-C-methyl-D-erythritol 4-phosphate cytidylyltransferase/2-C-methyl-D-erythritol 2,4-cyclodiphosphate synthase